MSVQFNDVKYDPPAGAVNVDLPLIRLSGYASLGLPDPDPILLDLRGDAAVSIWTIFAGKTPQQVRDFLRDNLDPNALIAFHAGGFQGA